MNTVQGLRSSIINCISASLLLAPAFGCDINSSTKTGAPASNEPHVTEDFFDDFEGDSVNETVWQIAGWYEHDGQTGAERCYVQDGYLNMVFINSSTQGFLSAAIQTWDEFLYGRWEARLKPSSVRGVLNSFYTIDWNNTTDDGTGDDGTKQEIDIEFLTNSFGTGIGQVHYAVHHVKDTTTFDTNPDIDLGFNPSNDFHVFGFEITPEHIQWFVDGEVLQTFTYNTGGITINAPYQLKLNVWSQNGQWVGGPPEENVRCVYQIDWIMFTPYSGE